MMYNENTEEKAVIEGCGNLEKQFYFKRTHDVDKEEFARLLKLAKGGRTMKSFSELCSATPSTFSRIIQGINKGPSSPDLLEAIAKNAVPNSGVTLQALANANGYTIEENKPHARQRPDQYFRQMIQAANNILCEELLGRQCKVCFENSSYKIGKSTKYKPDTVILTDAFGNKNQGETTTWCVEYILYPTELSLDSEPDYGLDSYNYRVKSRALDLFSRGALISMFPNNLQRAMRFSLVVIDMEAFDIIVREFSDIVLNFDMTLILIDIDVGCIVDEFMFHRTNIQDRKSFFIETEFINDEFDYDEEKLYFEIDIDE